MISARVAEEQVLRDDLTVNARHLLVTPMKAENEEVALQEALLERNYCRKIEYSPALLGLCKSTSLVS